MPRKLPILISIIKVPSLTIRCFKPIQAGFFFKLDEAHNPFSNQIKIEECKCYIAI